MRLAGQVAVVTGGLTGIGRAIADAFEREGATVHRVSRRTGFDVTSEAQVRRFFAKLKRLDILVNNAGVMEGGAIGRTSTATWSRVLATNLTGAMLCSRAALPIMKRRKRGLILMMSSVCGLDGWEGTAAYSASKHGMMGLAKALLDEGLPHGVKVSCVCPGMVRKGGIPHEDVAATALYLATLSPQTVVFEVRVDRRGALID